MNDDDRWDDDEFNENEWEHLWYEDYDDYEEPEPRPLTVLEQIGRWFGYTRIGRLYWRARHAIYHRYVDLSDIPF